MQVKQREATPLSSLLHLWMLGAGFPAAEKSQDGGSLGAGHVHEQSSKPMRLHAPVQAMQLSGKSQFPYMVDPNNGTSMLESDNIINYLWQVGSPLQHMIVWV